MVSFELKRYGRKKLIILRKKWPFSKKLDLFGNKLKIFVVLLLVQKYYLAYATMCGLVHAAEKQMPDAKNSNSAISKTCNSPEMEDFLESKISHLTIAEKDYATKKMLEIFTQWSNHPSSSFTKRLFSEKPQKRLHLNWLM